MENNFKNLLKKTKGFQNRENLEAKSFEFDLFKNETWFLYMNDFEKNLTIESNPILEKSPNIKAESSAIVSEISTPKLANEVNPDHKIKILFLGDTYSEEAGVEDLLHKMILAMKLDSSEFKRIPLNPALESISNLEDNLQNPDIEFQKMLDLIKDEAPLYVISLGATVTNLLLGRREKMSAIHGKFYKLQAHDWNYQLMPLFHPEFLLINPNMKRTAWIDLQEVMRLLGKI